MALCRNRYGEGWGPISPIRDFDLTPCFEDAALSALLATFILVSILRIYGLRKADIRPKCAKTRSWLAAKLIVLGIGCLTAIVDVVFTTQGVNSWYRNIEAYPALFQVLAFLVAFLLTRSNHTKTRRSSTILLTFWPLYVLSRVIRLRTWYISVPNSSQDPRFVLESALLGLIAIVLILECYGPELAEDLEKGESPYVIANVYSRLAFSWMTPLMKTGASRYITEEDMDALLPEDESKELGDRLQRHWNNQKVKSSWALWKALALSYGGSYALAAGLKVLQDILAFVQPQLLRILLAYISSYKVNSASTPMEGVAIACLMFISALIQTAILHQYFQLCFLTGMRVRAGLVTSIYKKALVLSNDGQGARGDIVNLMSVDATRMQDLCTYGLIFFSGPFQIVLAFVSLYKLLSWPAFVGVAIMVVSIPGQSLMARYLKNMQEKQMKTRDKRTRMMNELLNNIKSIKLYSWENAFEQMVTTVRNEELSMLRRIGIVSALTMVLWGSVPMLVALATFATAAYAGPKPLTADVIFPAIALFNLLQFPLGVFATIISAIVQASVSISRLAEFFGSDELQKDAVQVTQPPTLAPGDKVLEIKNGDFKWIRKNAEPALQDINLTVRKGDLIGIMGRVGSGKTSLLSAVVGEMTRVDGDVNVSGTVAYAPQNPWIMSTTVRDNIVFFRKFDQTFYDLVLDACALRQEIALLPDGDMTEVGEKGITLSGGQRARLSLARAVYARADLYLLDDVLAAVDAHVARHVFDNVIGPNGLLATKARLHVTNSVAFAKQHDALYFMRRGIILESGTYGEILTQPESELCKLLTGHSSLGNDSREASGTATPTVFDPSPEEDNSSTMGKMLEFEKNRRKSHRQPSLVPIEQLKTSTEQEIHRKSVVTEKEKSEQGKVKRDVYIEYIKAGSILGGISYGFAVILQQVFTIFSNLALKDWGENNRSAHPRPHSVYLARFAAFIAASSFFSVAAYILLLVTLAVRSARNLHQRMLHSVLRAPLRFFESTPQGRIMNLFSRDQNVVDEVLTRVFSGFFRTLAVIMGIWIVVVFSFPLSVVAIIPLAMLYRSIMIYYLATSREIKRLDAVSKSPIFSWFSESLGGLSTIRAYRLQAAFVATNEIRLDTNQRCYMPSTTVNRWLAVRLEFVGAFIVFVASILSMAALFSGGGVDAGLVGFVLSYALNTTQSLNWVVRSAGEVEQNIVSVERILGYIALTPEAPYEIPEARPADVWPNKGSIEFKNFSMRYRADLDRCLKDLNITIQGGERIGICGRTGAGKSSATLALLRILEADEGCILIDGVDISKIGLHDLRSSISIIPQEPQLFEGSIRDNIDPTHSHQDHEIWTALEQAHLKEYVLSLVGGLDAAVKEGGSSLSAGQRQLVCFARALLRKSKILVLDEATSAVDVQTEQAIQEIIHGPQFEGVTMLTIAHRLNTIMSSTRILVLDCGSVAEFDTPTNLLNDPTTKFYGLVSEAGLLNTPPKA